MLQALAMFRRGNRIFKQAVGVQNAKLPVVITFLMLVAVTMIMLSGNNKRDPNSVIELSRQKWNSFDSSVRLDPTVEFRNGTDLIWQIPESPKAVLFLAHGCNGRAANFWDKSPKCSNCVGLPEERLIVLNALARRFAIVAVSSAGRCWSLGEERFVVRDIIQWWVTKQRLEKLPLVALGASSGGYFVSLLATDMKFSSITIMIAEGMFGQMDAMKNYPPTLFVHMPKDEVRKHRIEKYLVFLREEGIDVKEVRSEEFPLTPYTFADRIPGLGQAISTKLFDLFQEKGFIDKNGYMVNDGRALPWKATLQEKKIHLPDKYLVIHIQEEMNLAYAYHEMTSLQYQEIFEWFESHLS